MTDSIAELRDKFIEAMTQDVDEGCPRCGAEPGKVCREPSGRNTYNMHQDRKKVGYWQSIFDPDGSGVWGEGPNMKMVLRCFDEAVRRMSSNGLILMRDCTNDPPDEW